LKNNKSFRTVALWALLIVIFVAIYQTVSRGGAGKQVKFSEFINEALPPTYVQNGTPPPMGPVTVYQTGANGEAVIAYAMNRAADGRAATAEELANRRSEFYTRGDLKMSLGVAEGGQTLYNALSDRGIAVSYKKLEDWQAKGTEEPFSSFVNDVLTIRPRTSVSKITIRGKEITGTYANGQNTFATVGDISQYRQALVARGIVITEENDGEGSIWLSILGTWLPTLFIFFLVFVFLRQMQAGGGKAMSFGKSKARLLHESANKVTFKDVAGIDEAKEELQEIIAFLRDPKKFTRLGGRIPKGVLLMGPPGTGKTLLAKGVAGEAGVPFFSISGSDFVEMFVGVGASRVRDLFEQGKKNAPCIIFIDEIDAVGRHRGAGLGGGHDEREQTLNQLLVEMDGFESNDGVILVAATNRPDVLDPALLRPGRFDRRVVVNRPDVKGRLEILKVHTRKARIARDVDLEVIARSTPGFAGADLENLVNEAALFAARLDKDYIDMADFESAKDKVLMGAERKSAVLSDEEKKLTAYHEAGHALVARLVKGNDPVHKVTIIPRGMALGLTWTLPESDQHAYSKEQVLARIAMAMGGRVAEDIVFGRITTGAGNDIEQATKLARRMVCEWGMSRLGPIALTKGEGSVFLGRDIGRSSDFSEQTQSEADAEIKRIVNEQHDLARTVVVENREVLERLAIALLELETLTGRELDMVFDGATLSQIRDIMPRKGGAGKTERPETKVDKADKPEKATFPNPEPVGSAMSAVEGLEGEAGRRATHWDGRDDS
jgi:cell division protease FtsH